MIFRSFTTQLSVTNDLDTRYGRKWQPTPVFLSEEFYGQRSLAAYSPWVCKRVGHNLTTNTVD